jgi:hypothetical protein
MSDVKTEYPPMERGCIGSACYCCISSCWNPLDECQKDDPTFELSARQSCLCFTALMDATIKPCCPANKPCINLTSQCSRIDPMYSGCFCMATDFCSEFRCSIPCNKDTVMPAFAYCCITCYSENGSGACIPLKATGEEPIPISAVSE